MIVKQGDAYQVPIELNMNGLPIPEEDIAAVEVYFGELRKTYPDDVSYQDSFIFSGTILRINIRKPAGLLKKRENFKGKRLSKLSFQQLYNI